MTFKNLVATLAHDAVYTAVSVARHPIGSAARAAGFVKGSAGSGFDLVRGMLRGSGARQSDLVVVPAQRTPEQATEKQATQAAPAREAQVVPKPVPDFDDLPEPIVITADDEPGEAFHHEPKPATRDSDHGDTGGDVEDATGYVEEIVDEAAEDELVWTSESDAPAAVDEPLLEAGVASAIRSESEMLRKAADPRVE